MADESDGGSYLLHDVFPAADPEGPLSAAAAASVVISATSTTPEERLASRRRQLDFAAAATAGDVASLHAALGELWGEEAAAPGLGAAALRAALAARALPAAEYLLRRGHAPTPAQASAHVYAAVGSALDAALAEEAEHAAEPSRDARLASARGVRRAAPVTSTGSGSFAAAGAARLAAATAALDARCDALCAQLLPTYAPTLAGDTADGQGAPPPSSVTPSSEEGAAMDDALTLAWLCARVPGAFNAPARATDGYTPLHVAALQGVLPPVIALLRGGVNVNAIAIDATTPLGAARLARGDAGDDPLRAIECEAIIAAIEGAGGAEEWRGALAAMRERTKGGREGVHLHPWVHALNALRERDEAAAAAVAASAHLRRAVVCAPALRVRGGEAGASAHVVRVSMGSGGGPPGS